MSTNDKSKGPIETFRDGAVAIKLWEHAHQERKYLNITISKSYKDDQGKWQEGQNMNGHDLLKLQNMIPDAYAHVQHVQKQHREHNQGVQDRLNQMQVDEMAHYEEQKRSLDMAAERDAVMQAAREPQAGQSRTQEHENAPVQDRSR